MLETRMDRLLTWQPTVDANRKLVQHLRHERAALFTFLRHPEVEATNWWGEQAIRPAVVTRKVCGGNRTWRGAHTQGVLMSVLRTCHQQGVDRYAILQALLRSPRPTVAVELLPRATGPPTVPRSPEPNITARARSLAKAPPRRNRASPCPGRNRPLYHRRGSKAPSALVTR
jgi:hypothetical protein